MESFSFETPNSLLSKLEKLAYRNAKIQAFHEQFLSRIHLHLMQNLTSLKSNSIMMLKSSKNADVAFAYNYHLQNYTFNITFNITRIMSDIKAKKLKSSLQSFIIDHKRFRYTIPDNFDNNINYGNNPIISTIIPDFLDPHPQKYAHLIIDGNHRAHKSFLNNKSIDIILTDYLSEVHFYDFMSFIFYKYILEIHQFYLSIQQPRDHLGQYL